MLGDRLSGLLSLEELKLAAGAVILSPFVPMLFMGQEYAENAPFLYFVSHSAPDLIEAVRKGRRDEFASFAWKGEAPDPQAEETFLRCKLRRELKQEARHRKVLEFHTELLRLRRSHPALRNLSKTECRVTCLEQSSLIALHRWHLDEETLVVLHFGDTDTRIELPLPGGVWRKELESSDEKWLGGGGRLPAQVSSNGKINLNVAGKSICLLTKIGS
jgi:maltooligosyltrehalose trehalohydrolase